MTHWLPRVPAAQALEATPSTCCPTKSSSRTGRQGAPGGAGGWWQRISLSGRSPPDGSRAAELPPGLRPQPGIWGLLLSGWLPLRQLQGPGGVNDSHLFLWVPGTGDPKTKVSGEDPAPGSQAAPSPRVLPWREARALAHEDTAAGPTRL